MLFRVQRILFSCIFALITGCNSTAPKVVENAAPGATGPAPQRRRRRTDGRRRAAKAAKGGDARGIDGEGGAHTRRLPRPPR